MSSERMPPGKKPAHPHHAPPQQQHEHEHAKPGAGPKKKFWMDEWTGTMSGGNGKDYQHQPMAPAPAPAQAVTQAPAVQTAADSAPSSKLGAGRARLIGIVSAAIGRAHTAYMAALGSLELDKRIENPNEFPLWAAILFAAGGKVLETAFSLSVKALRAAGAIEREVATAGVHVAAHEAEGIAHELKDKAWEAGISISVDLGKESAKAPLGAAILGGQQGVVLNYIDYLKDGSMVMFEQLAEKVYELDDAALVAAHHALAAANILPSKFKAFLEEKINAFMKTNIRKIGTRSGGKLGVMEHKVGWMYEPGAPAPRLIYVDEGFDQMPAPADSHAGDPGPAYQNIPRLSLGQDATWTANRDNTSRDKQHEEFRGHAHASGVRFVGAVEEEFQKEAVAQHQATWFEAPRNYRQVTNDGAPRLEVM